jgi:hypothetical protein
MVALRSSKAFALKAAMAIEILEGLVWAGPWIVFVLILIVKFVLACAE